MKRALILHVLPEDRSRGAQMFAGRLRDALRDDPEQDHRIVTVFRSNEGAARPDIRLDAPRSPWARILDPVGAIRLRRLVRETHPRLLVAHGGEALKYAIAARRDAGVVYKRTGLSSAQLRRAASSLLYRFLTRRCVQVVAVSRALMDQSRTLLTVPIDRLTLIPNGRDPDIYHPSASEDAADNVILFIGQFESGKRPGLFLDVISEVRRRGMACLPLMVGEGPLLDGLRSRAESLGVGLLGTRPDVPLLLRSAAVLVLTSEPGTEGLPGVLVEAGLSGVPVVSTRAAGAQDVVQDGVTGWMVPDGYAEIADRVCELLQNAPARRAMGKAARLHCAASYSISASAAAWRTLTKKLLEEGRPS